MLDTQSNTLAEVAEQAEQVEALEAAEAARNDAIGRARAEGHTLQAIADVAGLTRARVHQIVKAHPRTTGNPGLDAPAGFGASETRKWDAAVARHAFIGKCFAEAADPELTPSARVTAAADASVAARQLAADLDVIVGAMRCSQPPRKATPRSQP